MLVLRDIDVGCREVHEYLTRKEIPIIKTTELKEKSRKYKSFVVECNEAYLDNLFDEDLWDNGTFVKEFYGEPHPNVIHGTFPEPR